MIQPVCLRALFHDSCNAHIASSTRSRKMPQLIFFISCLATQVVWSRLVSDPNQVISQLLHRVGSSSRLNCLWVVRNENCLCRLDKNNTFAALLPPTHRLALS